jgi:Putative DNA-binding domain
LKLKDFQDLFQRAILDGDDAILSDIPDGPRETKGNLLGIYRDAYTLRLIEVLGNDHEQLRTYMGADRFEPMARAYIASVPSRNPNARWFSHKFPEFLNAHETYAREPVLADLAALERALNDAFDGADAPVLSMAGLAAIPAERWGELSFVCNPTATCLQVSTNVEAIWSALKAGKPPPAIAPAAEGVHILAWRNERTALFRSLGSEEAMMWLETAKGASFASLCQLLAAYDDPPSAPARAAGFLKGWLDAGLLSEAVLPD